MFNRIPCILSGSSTPGLVPDGAMSPEGCSETHNTDVFMLLFCKMTQGFLVVWLVFCFP